MLAFNDLTQGRNPLDRLRPRAPGRPQAGPDRRPALASPAARPRPRSRRRRRPPRRPRSLTPTTAMTGDGDDDASWDGCPDMTQWQHERRGTTERRRPPGRPRCPVRAARAVPRADQPHRPGRHRLRLVVRPRRGRRLGTDRPRRHPPPRCRPPPPHPRTRWCLTLLAPTAPRSRTAAHRGQHPWITGRTTAGQASRNRGRDPTPAQATPRSPAFLREPERHPSRPSPKTAASTRTAEPRYTPSRKLKHLVRARTATCPAPGCGAQAAHCDLDHTLAYPAGITCQCDLAPPCRRHHRVKQAPGWTLTQPEPGVMCWTTPAGRSYTTRPTVYEQ